METCVVESVLWTGRSVVDTLSDVLVQPRNKTRQLLCTQPEVGQRFGFPLNVRKRAKVRNRYNQAPHLTLKIVDFFFETRLIVHLT